MEDIVYYKLQMGILGKMVNAQYVKNRLHAISNFRSEMLIKMFGGLWISCNLHGNFTIFQPAGSAKNNLSNRFSREHG